MARAQGARAQMALGFETTYGTPPAANDFWRMPFARANLGSEQPLLASELLGYGRDPLPPEKDAITVDGDVVIPIDARYTGIWLKALFGEPVTTGSEAPYTHTFASGGWTLPSFATEVGMPDVPYFAMCSGCVANSIAWTMSRSGLITASVNVIAQGESVASSSAAGTLTGLAMTRFGAFTGAVRRNDVQLGNIVSAQVSYSNNLDRIETLRNDGKIDGADPSMATLTGTIEVRFANTALLDQATAGTPCELEFEYAVPSGPSLVLTAHAVYLPKAKVALEGPGGVQTSFAWQAARDAGVGRMATAVLINDQATYANP